ncbi:MAG TPA: hypothetical protein VFO21_25910 [Vicinamibacterales bacterium]|nr:hypothetical protein [Vicinamibacterales bacterium]
MSTDVKTVETPVSEIRNRLAVATGAALLVAGLVLVAVVLPAEYALDPLGTGAKLGLLDLGLTGQQVDALEAGKGAAAGGGTILAPQDAAFKQETITFEAQPREGFEYKYRLEKGEALLYSWTSSAPMNTEFHAEPDGAPRGYAQTYEKKDGMTGASGTLTAPFSGIHGWYWENTTDQPATVTLATAGYYNLSHEFRSGQPTKNKNFK